MIIKWLGKKVCDRCSMPITDKLYDVRLRQGPWAVLCHSCFRASGARLGVGLGQKYECRGTDFVKTKG